MVTSTAAVLLHYHGQRMRHHSAGNICPATHSTAYATANTATDTATHCTTTATHRGPGSFGTC